ATSPGEVNSPSPLPVVPQDSRKVPVEENFCIRLLFVSATYTVPVESTAIPSGPLNSPFPAPAVPHFVMKVPVEVNFCTRLLAESTTYTLSDASIAKPIGESN